LLGLLLRRLLLWLPQAAAAVSPAPLRLLHLPIHARPNPRPNDDVSALSFEAHECWENNPAKALPLFERAVIAAADRLGSDYFDTYEGEFWPWLDGRPYLRVLLMYAATLWKVGREAEAVAYMRSVATHIAVIARGGSSRCTYSRLPRLFFLLVFLCSFTAVSAFV
jgi:hypothetical protein